MRVGLEVGIDELRFDSARLHAVLYSLVSINQAEAEAMTAARTGENEVSILARVFDDERGLLPLELARSIVDVEFSDGDKARMHDLAVRNQADALSPSEKEELYAFAKAGTLLSILQSKARRTLKIKPKKRTLS